MSMNAASQEWPRVKGGGSEDDDVQMHVLAYAKRDEVKIVDCRGKSKFFRTWRTIIKKKD